MVGQILPLASDRLVDTHSRPSPYSQIYPTVPGTTVRGIESGGLRQLQFLSRDATLRN